ncbi:MAG: hypothetical protein IKN04_19715 [Clostridia bacterium]|nr:hypothetical protein [Clostridia bacterium]
MKKIACLLLAAILVIAVGTALADGISVSASYDNGTLTVSTTASGYFTISVDGTGTRRSLTPSVPSLSFSYPLEDGIHTVTIESDVIGSASTSLRVGAAPTVAPSVDPTVAPSTDPTVEPTVAPTVAPTVEPTAAPVGPVKISGTPSYQNGVIYFTVSGLTGYRAEVWLDGSATGKSVGNGSQTLSKRLEEGTHTLTVVYLDEQDSKTFTVKATTPTITGSYTKAGVIEFTVSNLNTNSEIWLDGNATGKAVDKDGSYTLNKTLECETTHTLTVYDPYNNLSGSCTIKVNHQIVEVAAKDPTCTEDGNTYGKKCALCGKVWDESTAIPALGHDVVTVPGYEATCKKAGLTDGEKCSRCGTVLKEQAEIPALGHHYVVVERTAEKVVYKCSRCGDTFTEKKAVAKETKNAYGAIVKDAKLVDVDYNATADMLDQKCLVITADLTCKPDLTTELGLYLDEALIAQLIKEGYATVKFVNGDATIVITLADIKPDWFTTTDAIWFYVFSTDPAAENGTLVKVEAQISGTEKIEANEFSGVVLKTAKGDLAVTANGIY